jgi:hypothetical protein
MVALKLTVRLWGYVSGWYELCNEIVTAMHWPLAKVHEPGEFETRLTSV